MVPELIDTSILSYPRIPFRREPPSPPPPLWASTLLLRFSVHSHLRHSLTVVGISSSAVIGTSSIAIPTTLSSPLCAGGAGSFGPFAEREAWCMPVEQLPLEFPAEGATGTDEGSDVAPFDVSFKVVGCDAILPRRSP